MRAHFCMWIVKTILDVRSASDWRIWTGGLLVKGSGNKINDFALLPSRPFPPGVLAFDTKIDTKWFRMKVRDAIKSKRTGGDWRARGAATASFTIPLSPVRLRSPVIHPLT